MLTDQHIFRVLLQNVIGLLCFVLQCVDVNDGMPFRCNMCLKNVTEDIPADIT